MTPAVARRGANPGSAAGTLAQAANTVRWLFRTTRLGLVFFAVGTLAAAYVGDRILWPSFEAGEFGSLWGAVARNGPRWWGLITACVLTSVFLTPHIAQGGTRRSFGLAMGGLVLFWAVLLVLYVALGNLLITGNVTGSVGPRLATGALGPWLTVAVDVAVMGLAGMVAAAAFLRYGWLLGTLLATVAVGGASIGVEGLWGGGWFRWVPDATPRWIGGAIALALLPVLALLADRLLHRIRIRPRIS